MSSRSWRVLILLLSVSATSFAVAPTGPSANDILGDFGNMQSNWMNYFAPYAASLFKILAAIDLAVSAAFWALEGHDIQGLVARLIRKLMVIGIFWALLVNGQQWLQAILDSFMQLATGKSGLPNPLHPQDILLQGLGVATTLFYGAAKINLLMAPGAAITIAIIALAVMAAYTIITLHFIVAMVEIYIVLGAGYIFLGFGGSRWTSPYAEKYLSAVIAAGTRIMVLLLVMGVGWQFAAGWQADAVAAMTPLNPDVGRGFKLMGEVLIYGLLCWIAPKIAANVIGGTLSMSAGEPLGMAAAAGTAAISAAGLAAMPFTAGTSGLAAGGAATVASVRAAAAAGNAAQATAQTAGRAAQGAYTAAQSATNATNTMASSTGAAGRPASGAAPVILPGGGMQPDPPSAPSASAGGSRNGGQSRSVPPTILPGGGVQPDPPPPGADIAKSLDASFEQGLNRSKDILNSVRQLPPDSHPASGPGLNLDSGE